MNTGNSTILGDMNSTNVLYVPEFKFNLLSVTRLTKDLSCSISFFPNFCTLQDFYSGKVIGIGREHNGLYMLKDEVPAVIGGTIKPDNHIDLWHIRLGHPSLKAMQHILSLKDHTDVRRHNNCQTCPLAKQCRSVFPESHSKSTKCFQLMHVDVWGPYRTPTYDKKQYFVTIIDDFSRFTWVCLIQCKTEVHIILKDFLIMVNTQFGVKVQTLRSDNGTEFFNIKCSNLLSSLGIVHQSSCAYTPQQNGVVKRKHGHIMNIARALRFHSGMSIRYWGHCVKTTIYLINKIPTGVLKGKSTHDMLYGKEPALNHLRAFGCLCFASILPRMDKFAPRAKKASLIGYSETQKRYRLLDLESHQVFISRDVTFMEHIFPFKDSIGASSDTALPIQHDQDIVKYN